MALNIPSIPFKLTPQDMGGFDLAKALHSGLQNYNQGVQSKYANELTKADIFNKMIGPLANIAISPLGLAMAPEQQQQIQQYISQALQGFQPQQLSQSTQNNQGGLLDRLKQSFGFQQNNQPTNNGGQLQNNGQTQSGVGQDNNYALLTQAGGGIRAGALASAGAPFQSSPVKPGAVYQNPNTGEVLSAPTGESVNNAQSYITNINSVKPIIKSLYKQAKPFLQKGGKVELKRGQIAGVLSQYGVPEQITGLIGDQEMANKYADFQSSQAQSIDRLMRIYNLPANQESQHTVQTIITPQKGENDKGYEARIRKELGNLSRQSEQSRNTLGSGIPLSKGSDSNYSVQPGGPKNGMTMVYKNGKSHLIPTKDVEDALTNWGYTNGQ